MFTTWVPAAKNVELMLNGDAIHPLLPLRDGYWTITLQGVHPGDRYQYIIDGSNPLPDPASSAQPDGVHQASAVVDRSFKWTDHEWKGISLGDMIMYEIHTGTFTPSGDFAGIVDKLDYLNHLGVNAIEIMPVAAFPGNRNWGYDGVYPFAVQAGYGGPNGLKQLVNEAHQRGIAVILDVVYNHLGPEGNYFGQYGPYFTDRYQTFWGKAINFDDAYCDGVRHFFWQNALTWLDEFHIDGLRMDAVHAIWDFSARHFIEALSEKVQLLEARTGVKKVLIAELDLNNPRYINPVDRGGYGMDGQWIDEFHHALHAVVTGEMNGYYEDFGDISHLVKAFRDSYVYTGQYSVHRKRHFGTVTENPFSQFVVFAQNHDQVGNRLFGDRLSASLDARKLKLVASVLLLSPHVPMLFMGEEYGEKNPFQYFISHTDADLIEAVRSGRKKEFAHFGWHDDIPDPQSTETFERCVLSWPIDQNKAAEDLFNHYRELIQFRRARSVFREKSRNALKIIETQSHAFSFEYTSSDDYLLVGFNFSSTPTAINMPEGGQYRKIFDSADDSRWIHGGVHIGRQLMIPEHAAIVVEKIS